MDTHRDHLNLDAAREQHDLAVGGGPMMDAARWAPIAGGALLALAGLSRRSPSGTLMALAGGAVAYLGYTGKLPVGAIGGVNAPDGHSSVRVERSVTIARPASDIYSEWRDIEQLPRIMTHLVSVKETADGMSHWVAKAPAGRTVEWDAEVIHDHESRVIAWRTVEGSDVHSVGSVRFDDAPGGRGTEVKVTLEYTPPGGKLGAAVAKLFGEEPSQHIADDLRRFKQFIETGEHPTTTGQPRGAHQRSTMDSMLDAGRNVVEAADLRGS